MVNSGASPYSKRLLHLISWGHWFTFFNILLIIVLAGSYLVTEPLPETLLGNLYLVATWLSHMAFLVFIGFMLLVFPVTLVIPRTRFIRGYASVIFTLGALLLVVDAFIYSRLGYHLNLSSVSQIIELINTQIKASPAIYLTLAGMITFAILAFELLISNYAWKHLKQLQQTIWARSIVVVLVIGFFFSHLTHIWADANLDYQVLKQDNMLPLSYPTTAKALLTKYGLFDRADYIERKNSPLKFTTKVPSYPNIVKLCGITNKPLVSSSYLVLTEQAFTQAQIAQLVKRSAVPLTEFAHHIDSGLTDNAWFNLFYSLPSIYQNEILAQQAKPALFQLLEQQAINTTLVTLGQIKPLPQWLAGLFNQHIKATDVSDVLAQRDLFKSGQLVVFVVANQPYQLELLFDALQLAQRHKTSQDILWLSEIGNVDLAHSLNDKTALLHWPNRKANKVNFLTSQMDLMPTLIKHWLACDIKPSSYASGKDLFAVKQDRVIANTVDNGILIYNKDKSVFVDQNGNFESYSRQLQTPISEKADFPLLIDGVHYIRQFSVNQKTAKKSENLLESLIKSADETTN